MNGELRPRWFALALLAPAGCCVAADTRVRTPRGEVAVGALIVGDVVESVDVATGRAVTGTVVRVRRSLRECLALRWRGGELVCTPDHPLYSPEHGDYRPASSWITGDARLLLARTGDALAPVEVASREVFAGTRAVVDISLAAEPRNFVAAGVVVHNKSIALDIDTETVTAAGPKATLSATDAPREFLVRICDGAADLPRGGTLWFDVTTTGAPPQSGATPMWLAVYHQFDGAATVYDDRVPGYHEIYIDSWDLPEATCSAGVIVGFDRVDDNVDGTIAVEWQARFEFFASDAPDAPAIIIENVK